MGSLALSLHLFVHSLIQSHTSLCLGTRIRNELDKAAAPEMPAIATANSFRGEVRKDYHNQRRHLQVAFDGCVVVYWVSERAKVI